MLYFELVFVSVIIILQMFVFFEAQKEIHELRSFFPEDLSRIEIIKCHIPKTVLEDNSLFQAFIEDINNSITAIVSKDEEEKYEVEVLVLDDSIKNLHPKFNEVVQSTNAYLCRNKGASADFNIIQDICERHIRRIDNGIGNLINTPLYIGLAGTFIGIIVGLSGIDFSSSSSYVNAEGINQLLDGVIAAMLASLSGLGLTLWNTVLAYKPAVHRNDTDKNYYYDFIQRELLPLLNTGMAGTLTSFRNILNHFVIRFGENIEEYHDSAKLLNENLIAQHHVLEEINKLSLTRTSKTIVETFANLKNSSEELKIFLDYQRSLNQNIMEAKKIVDGFNDTLKSFKSFNSNLESITQNMNSSIELQKEFKNMLEQFRSMLERHFPTIQDHRILWRNQIDELNEDIKDTYKSLTEYFQESTKIIQKSADNNNYLFTESIMEIVSKSNENLINLHSTIYEMRQDLKNYQKSNYDLNIDLIEAIKNLSSKIYDLYTQKT